MEYGNICCIFIDMRYSRETQNPSKATSWGFNSPSRHHLKYQYPLWIQSFAALVSALRSGYFGLATALRYEIRYSAHPLYFQ